MSLTLASEPKRTYTAPIVIAAIVLAAAIAATFYFNPHHTADLTAVRTDLFAPQTTFKAPAGSMHIIGAAPQVEQDVYAVVTIHLQDDLRLPLFIDEVDGRYVAGDDTAIDTVAPGSADLARIEDIFPQLKPMLPHPLLMGDTVPPKGSVEGQVLLHFGNIGAKDWQARRPSTLTVHFTHQDPITVSIP